MEIKLLFLEIQVGIAVLVILLVRFAMRKLPRVYSYMLWMLVFARLLVPVSFESRFALMPSVAGSGRWLEESFDWTDMAAVGENTGNIAGSNGGEDIEADTEKEPGTGCDMDMNEGVGGASGTVLDIVGNDGSADAAGTDFHDFGYGIIDAEKTVPQPGTSESHGNRQLPSMWNTVLLMIWAAGAAVVLAYNGAALMLVKKQIRGAKHFRDNIYISSQVKAPFTLGVFSPEIYLPPDLEGSEREYIICHEQIHIHRKDYLVKNLAFLLTAFHWFNPFVWAAFYYMERDMEMSCDEKVIGKMGQEIKRQYSQSLLNFAKGKCTAAVTPITFGENSVKQRVANVLACKTASRRAAALGAAVLFLTAVMIFTVRIDAQEKEDQQSENTTESSIPAVSNIGAAPEFIHAIPLLAQSSPDSALEYWARAFTDRDGDALFRLAADKEAFEQWEMVSQIKDRFVFGESSPWPWEYDYEIFMFPEGSTAEITFYMCTSVPEYYLVKETVRITELEGLYYVDHQSTWDNYSIDTGHEYEEAYGQGDIHGENDAYGDGSEHDGDSGYAEMAALYDDSFYRTILTHFLDNENLGFYSRFTDPVTAAKEILHLGEGTGEVTEWDMVPAVRLRSAGTEAPEGTGATVPGWAMASSRAGAGSRVIVTYTFAKDGSLTEIPMELKEESQGIWGLAGGGIREVYRRVDEPGMIEYNEEGSARGVYVIELSNYGIYRLGAHSGLTCLWAGDVGPEAATRIYDDKVYIFESLEREEDNSEKGTEEVFVVDFLTGELHREHLAIP